jgi:hypothetical protein
MHLKAKERITKGIDALAKQGKVADAVAMSKATAEKFGIHATHLDWSSHHDADQIAAELMDADHDARGSHDPHPGGKLAKPLSADEAKKLGSERCQKHLRRDCTLAVVLDSSMPEDQIKMLGHDMLAHAEEV